jgi:hypothetical protein
MGTSWVRAVLTAVVFVGMAIATSGCDWANVGSGW